MKWLILYLLFLGCLQAAEVRWRVAQDGDSATVTLTLRNDDDGAVYNSATLDLVGMFRPVLERLQRDEPGEDLEEIVGGFGMTINAGNTNEVKLGWSVSSSATTGIASLTNNGIIPDATYDVWRATQQNAQRDEVSVTINLGDRLDLDGDGVLDPEERLLLNGVVVGGFEAREGVICYYADLPRFSLLRAAVDVRLVYADDELRLFFTETGADQYVIEASATLSSDPEDWVPVHALDRSAAGDGEMTQLLDIPEGEPTRFWRVRSVAL